MSESTWGKVTAFVANNKAVIIVGSLAVVAATSAVLYSANLSAPTPSKAGKDKKPAESGTTSPTTGSSSSKKHGKKKKKSPSKEIAGFKLVKSTSDPEIEYPEVNDWAAVEALPKESRLKMGNSFKAAGNKAFTDKKYEDAITYYSSAIKCDPEEPIFWSNRAACSSALSKYDDVIADTTAALKLNPKYTKCLNRRAIAYEKLGNYYDSAFDFTCGCILTNFQDQSLATAVDRVLKAGAEETAAKIMESRPKNNLPSSSYITAFLTAFRPIPVPSSIENAEPDTALYDIKLALDAISKKTSESYHQAYDYVQTAAKKGDNLTPEEEALLEEYVGTFEFLTNDLGKAAKSFEKSLELHATPRVWIKLASVHMEHGNLMQAILDFEEALKLDPNSPDVYYHRGQTSFLTNDFAAAIKDYEKSIELDPEFVFTHIQLAITRYRQGDISDATNAFIALLKKFPEATDVHVYYGEILTDQGKFADAIKQFDKAIQLESSKKVGDINVLPFINKALASFQSSKDPFVAEELLRKAVTLDPGSDIAVGTLANICLQLNKAEEAEELFKRNLDLVRTPAELAQCQQYLDATKIQLRITKERPDLRAQLELASRTAMLEQQRAM